MQPVVKSQNRSYLLLLALGSLALLGTGGFAIYFMVKHGEGAERLMAFGASNSQENTDSGSTGSNHVDLGIWGTSSAESSQDPTDINNAVIQAGDDLADYTLISELDDSQSENSDQDTVTVAKFEEQPPQSARFMPPKLKSANNLDVERKTMEYYVLGHFLEIPFDEEPWMKKLQGGSNDTVIAHYPIYSKSQMDLKNPFGMVTDIITKIEDISNDDIISCDLELNYIEETSNSKRSVNVRDMVDQWSTSITVVSPKYMRGLYKECITNLSVAFATTYAFHNILRCKSINELNDYIETTGPFKAAEIEKVIESIKKNYPEEYNKISKTYGIMENYIDLVKSAYGIIYHRIRGFKVPGNHIWNIFDERFILANDLYLRLCSLYQHYDKRTISGDDHILYVLEELFPLDSNECILQPEYFYQYLRRLMIGFNRNIEILKCLGHNGRDTYDISVDMGLMAPCTDNYNPFRMLYFEYTFANGRVFQAYLPAIANNMLLEEYQFQVNEPVGR